MKTVIVYDSIYGNTQAIAEAIASAISDSGENSASEKPLVLFVNQVQPGDLEAADLLILGAPTHGALPSEAMQSLLENITSPVHPTGRAATFDTRLTWPFLERWGGFASPKMAEKLQEKGWTVIGSPGGFYVRGLKKGPLKKGEIERAVLWAKEVVSALPG